MKTKLKHLSYVLLISLIPSLGAFADGEPSAVFAARGSETERITIGGNISAGYQYIDVKDKAPGYTDPNRYNNFLMRNIQLCVQAELANGWSGLMNVDFAGRPAQHFSTATGATCPGDATLVDGSCGKLLERSFECKDQMKFYVDKAYIQKQFCDATFRFGYQKVPFGVEEITPVTSLKTVERSIATNFFTHLGVRAVNGFTPTDLFFTGNRFGGRHAGIFVGGAVCDFNYTVALVNGYQGICHNSDASNNQLGIYGSLDYSFGACNLDWTIGLNSGYQCKGSNFGSQKHDVYALNPFVVVKMDRFGALGELFWGRVADGDARSKNAASRPWGVNLIPTYYLTDYLELVGRFSYVNTDSIGTTIHNSFGCAPNDGIDNLAHSFPISSQTLFEKAYAAYLGFNYYMANDAVKFSLGAEQACFKNRDNGQAVKDGLRFDHIANYNAKVTAIVARLQLIF